MHIPDGLESPRQSPAYRLDAAAITYLLAVALVLASCAPATDGPSGEGAPAEPVIVEDACPFECCTYGTWVADDSLALHATPDDQAAVVAVIPPATRLYAPRGHVRVNSPGRARAQKPLQLYRQDGTAGPVVPVSGEVTILHPLGEGFLSVSYADSMWSSDLGWSPDGAAAIVEKESEWEWWAEVDLDGTGVGWLNASAAKLHGHDACGPPGTWRSEWLERELLAYASRVRSDTTAIANRKEASIDLNGDLYDDALVLLIGPTWCGTGGCTMLVFEGSNQGLELASRISLVRGPLIVSNKVSNGWRDIVVRVSGGGTPPKRVALEHDGRRYPANPSMLPPIAEDAVVEGAEVFGWP